MFDCTPIQVHTHKTGMTHVLDSPSYICGTLYFIYGSGNGSIQGVEGSGGNGRTSNGILKSSYKEGMFKNNVIVAFDKIWNERNWFIYFAFYLNLLSSLHKLVFIELQFYKNFPYIYIYIYIYICCICVYLKMQLIIL